jgi:hypothetical protein
VSQAVPPDAPRGQIETWSLGVEDLHALEGVAAARALHVRIVVRNRVDPAPWRLEARHVVAFLPGGVRQEPLLVGDGRDTLEIARGDSAVVDLYYAVPRSGDPPGFELDWILAMADRLVAGRVPFVRMMAQPADAIVWQLPLNLPSGWGRW